MLLHYATLLLTLSLLLVHNSNSQVCVRCSSDVPADDPIQKCETNSYFLRTSRRHDRLPEMDDVIYGNAGYYRSYGAEVYTSCKMTWVYNDSTMAMVHVEDSRGYISEAVQFKPTTRPTTTSTNVITEKRYFAIPNPTPLADYFCVCKLTAVGKPEEVKSCLQCNSSRQPLPPIKTCSVDTCYSNQDQPMCYENVRSGDVYHNWPHQLFNNDCPYAAKQFDNECWPLDDFDSTDLITFYMGDQLVHSGSVYYVIGDETLVVRSKCDIKAAGLKCQAWIWKNTTGIGERIQKIIKLDIKEIQRNQLCSVVTFDIRAADFISNIDKNWAVNLVGCHHPDFFPKELKKQVEFYINFVDIVKSVGPSQNLVCLVSLQTKDVVEPAVTLSPDTCACNLTLVSCNPMVTVRRVEHTFRCDNGKLWTGSTIKTTKMTKQSTGSVFDGVLKFAHIMYRHGDRTSLRHFAKDDRPYAWYQGPGELTPAGMRRHYQLGLWFRQRYATFLNDTFEQKQIYVRSTDSNRTIMSAMCNLAGLYPPKGEQKWNTNINWQPIPVRVVDKKHDNILRRCPKVNGHDTSKRHKGGPVLGDIVSRMEEKWMNTLYPKLKIYFYSAHDTTVSALLKVMDINVHTRQIPYTCAVMVELYESTTTGTWTVRVFMKNDTGEMDMGAVKPHELQVGGCPPASPCPLQQFRDRSRPFIPEDWAAECKTDTNTASHRATTATKRTTNTVSHRFATTPIESTATHTDLLTITKQTGNKKHATRKALENEPESGTAGKYTPHGADELKDGPTDNDRLLKNQSSMTPMKELSTSDKSYSSQGPMSPTSDTSSESSEESTKS